MVMSSPEPDGDEGNNAVFTVNGEPVKFYLYGTQEDRSPWTLTEGAREKLKEKILVRLTNTSSLSARRWRSKSAFVPLD